MSRYWIPLLVVALGTPPLGAQAASLDSVAQLLSRFDETGSGRGAALAQQRADLFSADAVFVNAFGVRVEGQDSIRAFWNLVYTSGSFASSKIERVDRQQRVLSSDLVLIDHVERITGQRAPDTGREMAPRVAHITLLLRREATGAWRIVYYRAGDVRQ